MYIVYIVKGIAYIDTAPVFLIFLELRSIDGKINYKLLDNKDKIILNLVSKWDLQHVRKKA